MTRSPTFSRALRQLSHPLRVFTSSFDWCSESVFFVIGQGDYLGFGFPPLDSPLNGWLFSFVFAIQLGCDVISGKIIM